MKIIVPALLALSFPVAVIAAPAKPAIAAKSQIDARGVAALDKAVAYYKKQRSFSVSATEKLIYGGKTTRNSRLQISLQAPYRASLKVTALEANGQSQGARAVRLLGAKSLYLSQLGEPAQVEAVGATPEAREQALKEVLGDAPGIALSVVIMSLGNNPASDSYIQSVRYGEIRENGKTLKSVTVVRKTPNDATGITAEFRLSPQTYAVEKTVIQIKSGGKIGKIVTEIGRPTSNWRGSQSATDAAIYNWKTLAPGIALIAATPPPKISIDPKARAIFGRSSRLYSSARGLKARWKGRDEYGENFDVALDFERAGRLRLTDSAALEPLVVFDGKNRWSLGATDLDGQGRATYSRAQSEEDEAFFELLLSSGMQGALGNLLDRNNPLDDEVARIGAEVSDLRELRALLLPAQPLNGQACDLVRISQIHSMPRKSPQTVEQQTYWFARSDGALVRFQERSVTSGKETSASDSQITEQNFNPQFAPDTFKFTPPPGAKLETD